MESKINVDGPLLPEFVSATARSNELVTAIAEAIATIASSTEAERLAAESRERVHRFVEYKPSIAVVGRFKAGKSTVVNELLNANSVNKQQYSAVDSLPATRVTIRYEYSLDTYARIHSSSGESTDISANALRSAQILTSVDPIDEIRASAHEELVVGIPSEILRAGIVVVDTPGFGISEDQAWLLNSLVSTSDIVLYVIRASQLGSLQDSEMLELVRKYTDAQLITIVNLDQDLGDDDRFLKFAAARLVPGRDKESEPIDRLTSADIVLFGASGQFGSPGPRAEGGGLLNRLDGLLSVKVQQRRFANLLPSLGHLCGSLREQLRVRQIAANQMRQEAAAAIRGGHLVAPAEVRVRMLAAVIDDVFRHSAEDVRRALRLDVDRLLWELEARLDHIILREELPSASGILLFPEAKRRAVDKLLERCAKEASATLREWSHSKVEAIVGPSMKHLQERLSEIVGKFRNDNWTIDEFVGRSLLRRGESVGDAFESASLLVGNSTLTSLSARIAGDANITGMSVGATIGMMLAVPMGSVVGAIVGSTLGGEARLRAVVRQEMVPFILNKTREAGLGIVEHVLSAISAFSTDFKAEITGRLQDELRLLEELATASRKKDNEASVMLEHLEKALVELDSVAKAIEENRG